MESILTNRIHHAEVHVNHSTNRGCYHVGGGDGRCEGADRDAGSGRSTVYDCEGEGVSSKVSVERVNCGGFNGDCRWHLPIFLVIALLFGYLVPVPGAFLNELDLGGICFGDNCVWNSIGSLCVTLIFFISGTKLKTDEIKNALSAWKAASYGIGKPQIESRVW